VAWLAVPSDLVTAQIEAVVSDMGCDAVKTGMLANAAIVEAVAAAIASLDLANVIVDPVMLAKSGDSLLEDEAVAALRAELLPRASVITPNIPEAEALSGVRIRTMADAREAAQRLRKLGPAAVVIKGGHLPSADVIDLLFDGDGFHEFTGERIDGSSTHGTGCTFASALTANLANGLPLAAAVAAAKAYVAGAIRHAPAIGKGHGPMNHFWQTTP
jgi:hydroxymethylpyrimidine/phosphomethylpyrimidine kinase